MPRIIRLTTEIGNPVLVNPAMIIRVRKVSESCTNILFERDQLHVRESLDEIERLINQEN